MTTRKQSLIIWTLGHSTRSLDEFIELLTHYHITHVIDIRTIPRSRHNPQFNEEDLRRELKHAHITYTHMKALGGLRHTHKDSVNTAWRNVSFRGFADYMQTHEFQKGIEQLIDYAQHDRVALMCAEAVPWRCHRSLVGDALVVRNIDVEDIFSRTIAKPHVLTPWAHVQGESITYPQSNISTKDS